MCISHNPTPPRGGRSVNFQLSLAYPREQLLAVVAEGAGGRVYVDPPETYQFILEPPEAQWLDQTLPDNARWFSPPGYGLGTYKDLFTPRQLVALTTFSDLVSEARERVLGDAITASLPDDGITLSDGGTGAQAYADSVITYLAFAVDRSANYWSTLTPWGDDFIVQTFGRQAIPMVWDFAEGNPFSNSTGHWNGAIGWITKCLDLSVPAIGFGLVKQLDATARIDDPINPIIFTDPPYYDNIGYADLSDYFYVWLRRSLRNIYPDLFSTLLTPKTQELIASPYRFDGDRQRAKTFFEEGLRNVFAWMSQSQNNNYPLTIFYAFKQAEAEDGKGGISTIVSTGWETMLGGLLSSGLSISGTWPLRTERDQGLKTGTNVLASSIILACRPRNLDAPLTTRKDFLNTLRRELPDALKKLKYANIAPVDLAQASIGPGMAVFSRNSKVLEADGTPMTVRTALGLINQTLDEILAEQEGEVDPDTRWAVAWFEQHGHDEGPFGDAETLSKAKNVAVNGLVEAGILESKKGKARLLKRDELDEDWDPATDTRLTTWEISQHLIRILENEGEMSAADLVRKIGGKAEEARDLAYRLYTICDRKKWANEALPYNALVIAWPEIIRLSSGSGPEQLEIS